MKKLCAFPLTPITQLGVDTLGFLKILDRLREANVDSVGILGSTGSYAYLTREQRRAVTVAARDHLGCIPMMVCIGAISTNEVLHLMDDAINAGANTLLLPPMSYQKLNAEEVFSLFETVAKHSSVPICLYDNPGTTHFTFTDELYARIASLPGVQSIKMPGVPSQPELANQRIEELRKRLNSQITLGVSGDAYASQGLNAGCDIWYSVFGGLFPADAMEITRASSDGDVELVAHLCKRLDPLWELNKKHDGSIRVMAAAAALLGLVDHDCLPRPMQPMLPEEFAEISSVISTLRLK